MAMLMSATRQRRGRVSASAMAILIASALVAACAPPTGPGAPSDVDVSFGDGGSLRIDLPRQGGGISAAAVGPDGSTVVVTEVNRIRRLRPDGTLDASFGTDGVFATSPSLCVSCLVSVDGLGRIYVVESQRPGSSNDVTVTRVTATGDVDTDYAPPSIPRPPRPTSGTQAVADLAVSPGGDVALAFTTEVVLVPADGTAPVRLARPSGSASGVEFDASERLVVATAPDPAAPGVEVRRHLAGSLSPDPSFGTAGLTTATAGASGRPVVLVDDGERPLVVRDSAVLRLTAGGAVDPSYGAGGTGTLPGPVSGGTAPVVVGDRVAAVGDDGPDVVTVVGLDADGQPDPALGGSGRLELAGLGIAPGTAYFGSPSTSARVLAAAPEGDRLVVAAPTTVIDPALGRTHADGLRAIGADGLPDPSFDDDGAAELRVQPIHHLELATIDPAPGGALVTFEEEGDPPGRAVVKVTAAGALDSSYGVGGWVGVADAHSISVDPDGRVVVSRRDRSDAPEVEHVARFDADGRPDPMFGGDGQVSWSRPPATWACRAHVTTRDDGAVAVWYQTTLFNFQPCEGAGIDLLTPAGELIDRTVADLPPSVADLSVVDARRGPGSTLVVEFAGLFANNDGERAIARFTSDGLVDAGYAEGGVVDLGPGIHTTDFDVMADGSTVFPGSVHRRYASGTPEPLSRIGPDGRPVLGTGGFDAAGQLWVPSLTGFTATTDRIVVIGDHGTAPLVVRVYRPDGTPDPDYPAAGGGVALFGPADNFGRATRVGVVGGRIWAVLHHDSHVVVHRLASPIGD